MDIIMEKII